MTWDGFVNTKPLFYHRELAQLVERHPYKVDVAGSNPVLPTNPDSSDSEGKK